MIRSAKALLLAVSLGCLMFGQAPVQTPKTPDNKAGAYYNFAMGRVTRGWPQAWQQAGLPEQSHSTLSGSA
jgi:hypothetical protein